MIDPRAIIHPDATLGRDVSVGPWTIIGAGVELGAGSAVASHVVIGGGVRIGQRNRILQFASIGVEPFGHVPGDGMVRLEIGDDNLFQEGVKITGGMAGTLTGTCIGSSGTFMPHSLIGPDCRVGDRVLLGPSATLGAGAVINSNCRLGAQVVVAAHSRVGRLVDVLALSRVEQDVPDCLTVSGCPAVAVGLNRDGLAAAGIAPAVIARLAEALNKVGQQELGLREVASALESVAADDPAIGVVLASIGV